MSRLRLTLRLAGRDLRRRAPETLLLFVALVVAATTLTIGLVLHDQTAAPYAETRTRTAGPDVVASVFPAPDKPVTPADLAGLAAIVGRPEVAAHSPAFPMTWTSVLAGKVTGVAELQGRDANPSAVDRPQLVSGQWLTTGAVVVERAFAQALGVRVGDTIELNGGGVRVAGIAVSAALPPYPQLCTIGCILDRPDWFSAQPGLVWATRAQVVASATPSEPLVWFQYLRLHDPAAAPAFAAQYGDDGPPSGRAALDPWQDIAARPAETLASERTVIVFGSTLLVVLALATLVVMVGGRMTDEVRRVGTLKATGATPGFVVRVLLASYLAVGLFAGLIGLALGRLVAPRLVTRSAGLLGRLGGTTLSVVDAVLVVGVILAIVLVSSVVPAVRAVRTSTMRALADAGHAPHRARVLLALSSRLPTPALLGLRLAGRRPRRALLTTLSIAVAVCGSVVAVYAQASAHAEQGPSGGPADPQAAQLHSVMVAVTLLLAVMTAVNLIFVTRASAADARGVLAVVRALGASPAEAAIGLGIAQLVPAVVGLVLGGVSGVAVFQALSVAHAVAPPLNQLAGLAVLTVLIVVGLTAIPARLEARRPVAATLREA